VTVSYERTSYCGELRAKDAEKTVTLAGWIQRRRDHGNIIFVDLRDRTGIVQIVFNPEIEESVHDLAQSLRSEFVIAVTGKVSPRPEESVNPKRSAPGPKNQSIRSCRRARWRCSP